VPPLNWSHLISALIFRHKVADVQLPEFALESLQTVRQQLWPKHLVKLIPGEVAAFSSLPQQAPGLGIGEVDSGSGMSVSC
jgi:hypothetical protein